MILTFRPKNLTLFYQVCQCDQISFGTVDEILLGKHPQILFGDQVNKIVSNQQSMEMGQVQQVQEMRAEIGIASDELQIYLFLQIDIHTLHRQ